MPIEKNNKNKDWTWTIGLLLASILISYLTKVWFLFLLFPLGMFTFRKK